VLAEGLFHPAEPAFVVAVEAVSVDAEEHFDGVPGPFGDQGGRGPGVKAAPLCGAGSGAPRAGLCVGTAARHARAVPAMAVPPI
jgi:hypothetical protein